MDRQVFHNIYPLNKAGAEVFTQGRGTMAEGLNHGLGLATWVRGLGFSVGSLRIVPDNGT